MAEQALSRQRPMANLLKSRRTLWREAENPIRWAYDRLLREHDKTRQVFPVNPYAEVHRFRDNVYGILTHSLDGMGDPWSYLIRGPEKVMLIDTGFGLGDLKGLVREIVGDMPCYVVNTHCAYDHSYGNTQFETVFCHEYEAHSLRARMNPGIWDYLFDQDGKGVWAEFDRADLVPFREYTVVGVPDGTTFSLGTGHEIDLVFLPGHSCGHAAYLDRKERILFAGDDACFGAVNVGGNRDGNPHARFATVEALRGELLKVVARADEIDGVFPGHGPVDMGPIVLENVLEACEAVLTDPTCYHVKREVEKNGRTMTQYGRMIYQSGHLRYTLNSLYMDRVLDESV